MLIFHSPRPVMGGGVSGSSVRPAAMLDAFRALDVDVYQVDGDSRQRAAKWATVASIPSAEIAGVYSELSTMPIALADADHLPRAPFLDFARFARLRRMGVPVAAFYRDVYWRFPHYAATVPLHKRLPALAFYQLEAWQLSRHVDHVFLPSMRMKEHIPYICEKSGVSALPPGGVIQEIERAERSGPLRLFYVGGVGGEQYDVSPILHAVGALEGVRLTLCCREAEWRKLRDRYASLYNVDVVHRSGPQLDALYRSADVFIMWWRMSDYLRFAMPVKLGEAIGWGLPIIANSDCEMGDTVARDGLGWTPKTDDELIALLLHLRDAKDEVAAMQARVAAMRDQHSWRARAEAVLSTLARYRSGKI